MMNTKVRCAVGLTSKGSVRRAWLAKSVSMRLPSTSKPGGEGLWYAEPLASSAIYGVLRNLPPKGKRNKCLRTEDYILNIIMYLILYIDKIGLIVEIKKSVKFLFANLIIS